MKKVLLTACLVTGILTSGKLFSQNLKYVDNIYNRSSITVTKNIMYADAYTVIAAPNIILDTLRMDMYDPTGNTDAKRPLIILTHTGSFLPRYKNGTTTGARDDSATVEIAKRFAEKGYVVACVSYRLGWNPYAATEELRKESIINAAYKGVQDVNTAVRFFKENALNGGNTWKIDTTKIVIGGQGTGGYLTYAHSGLQRQTEIKTTKFTNFSTNKFMVNDTVWGDIEGFPIAGSPYARALYKGHNGHAAIGFAIGGAMGDTAWMEAGEYPIMAAQGIADPFAPYTEGMVYVPGTTPPQAVITVQGAHNVMQKETKLGNNICYKGQVHDYWTNNANKTNDGIDGLYGFAGAANGSGPWEWWDSSYLRVYLGYGGIPGASITKILAGSSQANPFMSKTRALKYIDTVTNYFAPRLAVCLGYYSAVNNKMIAKDPLVSVSPNPTSGELNIVSEDATNPLQQAIIFDLSGRMIRNLNLNGQSVNTRLNLSPGVYMLKMEFREGSASRKIVVQ